MRGKPLSKECNVLDPNNLPTDLKQMEEEAVQLLAEDGTQVNAVLILAQQDPIALGADGQPKYTEDQRRLIIGAFDTVQDWKS